MDGTNKTSVIRRAKIPLFFLLACCACFVAVLVGRYPISFETFRQVLFHPEAAPESAVVVLFTIRLPRVLSAVFIGAALSGTGAVYQTIFKNPMVSPSVLGASSGAAFGAALGMLLELPQWAVQLSSFVLGVAAVMSAVVIASLAGKGSRTLVLVLAGMLVGTFFSALISLVKYVADPQNILPAITYWLMGSLSNSEIGNALLMGAILLACTILLYALRWRITVLSLEEDEAKSLGINPAYYRFVVIICATLMTSAAVSMSGIIGWVGLVVPHIARLLSPGRFDEMFIDSIFIGGLYLLLIDTLSRVATPMEFPLGILTALIGAPFFAFFLLKRSRGLQ
jgi:iron complex transport system permease protein